MRLQSSKVSFFRAKTPPVKTDRRLWGRECFPLAKASRRKETDQFGDKYKSFEQKFWDPVSFFLSLAQEMEAPGDGLLPHNIELEI